MTCLTIKLKGGHTRAPQGGIDRLQPSRKLSSQASSQRRDSCLDISIVPAYIYFPLECLMWLLPLLLIVAKVVRDGGEMNR